MPAGNLPAGHDLGDNELRQHLGILIEKEKTGFCSALTGRQTWSATGQYPGCWVWKVYSLQKKRPFLGRTWRSYWGFS